MGQIIIEQTANKINESISSCFSVRAIALRVDDCARGVLQLPAGHRTSAAAAKRRVID